jgi:TonB family protein
MRHLIFLLFLLSSSLRVWAIGELPVLIKVNPIYPIQAYNNKIEGWVVITYDISKLGVPFNVRVSKSSISNIFDSSAIDAVKQWRYRPDQTVNEQYKDMRVSLVFSLDKAFKSQGIIINKL